MSKFQIYQQMARVIRWMHMSHEQRRTQMIILYQMIERDCGDGEHIIAETLKAILTFGSVSSLHGAMTHTGVKAALRLFEQTCAYWIEVQPKLSMAQRTTDEEISCDQAEMRRQDADGRYVQSSGDIPF